jgi:hypothetical protein
VSLLVDIAITELGGAASPSHSTKQAAGTRPFEVARGRAELLHHFQVD